MTTGPSFSERVAKLTAFSYVAGPALLVGGAALFLAGVGPNRALPESWAEGMVGAYGVLFMIPVYLDLARRLGERSPRLGLTCAVTGTVGGAVGFMMMAIRPLQAALWDAGSEVVLWSLFEDGRVAAAAGLGPLFPLTSLLLGIGHWRARTLPRPVAAALVLAGMLFPLGQVAMVATHVVYPLACALWLVVLAPLGIQALRGAARAPAPSLVAAG